jgi:hypothetical protein
MVDRGRALILGWHASTERQLRGIARWYEARGFETRTVITPTFRTMGLPGAWRAFGEKLARDVDEKRPLVIHAFSNAGFWTMSALLDAMAMPPARVIIDSAPGFPEKIPMWMTAKFATAAMMPGLLASLGRRPRSFHPLLTPPIAFFFGAWHLVARRQIAFMQSGQQRVIDRLRDVPLLAIWSDADTLVPAEHVGAFLDRAERGGVRVERLHFEDSAHVRHFVQHRAEYFARLEAFVR